MKEGLMENVIAVNFGDDTEAYKALTLLKELDDQRQLELTGAAVVVRGEDGRLDIKDDIGDTDLEGTATGGIVGLLIGILGGPPRVLVGGAPRLFIRSPFDVGDAPHTEAPASDNSRPPRPRRAAPP